MKIHKINIKRFQSIAYYLHYIDYWKERIKVCEPQYVKVYEGKIERTFEYINNYIDIINCDKKGEKTTVQ